VSVLFVCTGNICRSPMAEAIARHLHPDGSFASAGLYAVDDAPASPNAVRAAAAMDGDASRHRARQFTLEMADRFDQIFVMTREHVAAIEATMPSVLPKVELLDPDGADVDDPFGMDMGSYLMTAGRIRELLEARLG